MWRFEIFFYAVQLSFYSVKKIYDVTLLFLGKVVLLWLK
jgi:hypothetical protein